MALTIIKQPDTMSYIPYGNNIIFEFSESNMSYSEIEIVTDRSTILRFYSSPAGVVYVNLKNIIRSLVKNANLEDGSKYPEMILKATIIIRTYNRTNVLLSELQFANCIFVPRVVEYGINPYDFPNTSMMPMNSQKIVRFGNLPLYCYYMLAGEPHRIDPALVQFFDVEMRPNQCGTYLKFLNKMGGLFILAIFRCSNQ